MVKNLNHRNESNLYESLNIKLLFAQGFFRGEAFDTGTESVKEAFRRADEAMYHAKNACKEAHMKETDAASQI